MYSVRTRPNSWTPGGHRLWPFGYDAADRWVELWRSNTVITEPSQNRTSWRKRADNPAFLSPLSCILFYWSLRVITTPAWTNQRCTGGCLIHRRESYDSLRPKIPGEIRFIRIPLFIYCGLGSGPVLFGFINFIELAWRIVQCYFLLFKSAV